MNTCPTCGIRIDPRSSHCQAHWTYQYKWVCDCGDLSAPDSIGECARCKRPVLGHREKVLAARQR